MVAKLVVDWTRKPTVLEKLEKLMLGDVERKQIAQSSDDFVDVLLQVFEGKPVLVLVPR